MDRVAGGAWLDGVAMGRTGLTARHQLLTDVGGQQTDDEQFEAEEGKNADGDRAADGEIRPIFFSRIQTRAGKHHHIKSDADGGRRVGWADRIKMVESAVSRCGL
jgi:hypothetical protein